MRASYIVMLALTAGTALARTPDSLDHRRRDSSAVIVLPAVVVEAENIVTSAAAQAHPTSVLTRATIAASQARDAADVVALAPGAFVRQYGGQGGMRTLSLRGTSSQQTLVLVDGVRYQSSAVGAVDLGGMPSSALQRVEVLRGGDASRFGANALGGVVNLVTDRPRTEGSDFTFSTAVGSFGELDAAASASASVGANSFDASIAATRADGTYPFAYREYGEQAFVHRENADYTRVFTRASWMHRSDSGMGVGATLIGFDTDRGVPGAIVQGQHEQRNARMAEREVFGIVRSTLSTSHWKAFAAFTMRANRLEYRDPDERSMGAAGIDSRYDRNEYALIVRAIRPVDDNGVFEAAAEISHARLDGNNLDPDANGSVERLQWGATLATNWAFEKTAASSSLALDASIRVDGYSDLATAISPTAGIVFRPFDAPLRLRARGALNYRVPSFTEQYYLNYGNTDLRPEHSRSLDVGATFIVDDALVFEAGGFIIDTRDQIIAVPRSPLVWSAKNVARTLSRGIELAASGTAFDGHVAVNISYTRMRAEDRTGATQGNVLVYTPEEFSSALVEWRPDVFAVGATWQHASHRHTLPSNAIEAVLPHYDVVNAHVAARGVVAGLRCSARIEVFNLIDAQYQVVRNYPMPGRSFRLGLEVAYENR